MIIEIATKILCLWIYGAIQALIVKLELGYKGLGYTKATRSSNSLGCGLIIIQVYTTQNFWIWDTVLANVFSTQSFILDLKEDSKATCIQAR